MEINEDLKEKLGGYGKCPEYVWKYIGIYFDNNEKRYIEFLNSLDRDMAQKCVHSLFFFWAQNPLRIVSEDQRSPNLDIFVYILTLSVVEFLTQDVKKSWDRINGFFNTYLRKDEIEFLNGRVKARREGEISSDKTAVRILYDMRNDFIHNAQQFPLISPDGEEFASVKFVGMQSGDKYLADVRINLDDYLTVFWKAYFRFFGLEL